MSTPSLAAVLATSSMLTFAGANRATTVNGPVAGSVTAKGVRIFKGIPYARPPVGGLRWKAPQPLAAKWTAPRDATRFGPRCVQHPIFGDMNFRSNGMSEDCLYLNVWAPAKGSGLPVLVYFFGGGYMAGDGSEPRYDGESMAEHGIVAVTVNYRLGVFGFLSHPDLTRESPNKASGNYGLLDQNAALRWVRANIQAFGGDPDHVTIAGESAGSTSVSAQVASPLSKGLFAAAIGESGSLLGTLPPVSLSEGEKAGEQFAASAGARTIAELRAMSTDKIQEFAKPRQRFPVTVDGWFLPEAPRAIFRAGKQSHVALLAGWNSEEQNGRAILGREEPTEANLRNAVAKLYPANTDEVMTLYGSGDILQAATDLAGDRFIGYSTWKWLDMHLKTGGGKPVYRYFYTRPRPAMRPEMGADASPGLAGGVVRGTPPAPAAKGAVHSAEIEYAMGNLSSNQVFAWTEDDYKVSRTMQGYFVNFIKKYDPNGPGLPAWPKLSEGQVMYIDVESIAKPEANRDRYLFLDRMAGDPNL